VALARALAFEPEVLLLDEPLSALDAKIRVSLRAEIRAIQRQLGITTVYVTHDQEEALSLSDRIVVMSDGHIEQIGTPFQVYNFPTTAFVASFVGTLNVLPATVVDSGSGRLVVGGQQISISHKIDAASGATISLALRPEMVSLGGGPEGSNVVRGTVADVSFLGSIVRIKIAIAAGVVVTLDVFNEPTLVLPSLEESVSISFPAEGPLVLDSAPVLAPDLLAAEA
ncbi:MAG: ABC transporter ATP-binding protein, partial [Chloroflexota bacterium]